MVEKEAGVSVKRGGFLNKRGKKLKQRERERERERGEFLGFLGLFFSKGSGSIYRWVRCCM